MKRLITIILIIVLFSMGINAEYDNSSLNDSVTITNGTIDNNISDNTSEDINNTDVEDTFQYKDHTKMSIRTKNLGRDRNWNAQKVLINITINRLGNLTYIEEYFSVDSHSQPKFYSSQIHYESKLTKGNISFEILRPRKNLKTFILTKGIIILDGKMIYERWITSNISNYITINSSNKDRKTAEIVNTTATLDITSTPKNKEISNTIPYQNENRQIFMVNNNTNDYKKTPGFEIIGMIFILVFFCLFRRK